MGARHIGFLGMACAFFQLSCAAAAPHRGSNDASVADGTATVQRPSGTLKTAGHSAARTGTFVAQPIGDVRITMRKLPV